MTVNEPFSKKDEAYKRVMPLLEIGSNIGKNLNENERKLE